MQELIDTLLPNLPESLLWVKGVLYIIEFISFSVLIVSPVFILGLNRRGRR